MNQLNTPPTGSHQDTRRLQREINQATAGSWHARLLLIYPRRIAENLEKVALAGITPRTPNLWQIELGVLRMWHRVLFRSETIGTCAEDAVRDTWRAKLLQYRPLRFPFLLRERAVAPLDFSGLASSPERIISHLVGAHHDGSQFAYDFALLSLSDGGLDRALAAARQVLKPSKRSAWLRDLVVYEGYHERLVNALEQALAGNMQLSPGDNANPDITFPAYLAACAEQPETPAETLKAWFAGTYRIDFSTGDPAEPSTGTKANTAEWPMPAPNEA